jgi:hypothetical protein
MLLRKRFGFSKKTIIAVSVVTVALVCLVVGIFINQSNAAKDSATKTAVQPPYSTILPKGKSISALGGWTRVSPAESSPVYAYADTIANVPITVSEQPLPDSFKSNVDSQVAELAKSYSATDQITASNGVKVYVGTSSKGPQSVILTKINLLILIKSQKKIDDTSWKKYVDSLN